MTGRCCSAPVFAFGTAASELSMFGVGAFLWALVTGVALSRRLERERWATLRQTGTSPA